MGYQSAALAYNFGLNYEFGKRVIKSMSNEKFNKIAEDPILLNELTSKHHDVLLQAFINEVPKVDKIQDLIIKKMVELEFAKIKVMPELLAQIPKGFIEGLFALGQGDEAKAFVTTPEPTGRTRKPTPTTVVKNVIANLEFKSDFDPTDPTQTARSNQNIQRETILSTRLAGQSQKLEYQRLINIINQINRVIGIRKKQSVSTPQQDFDRLAKAKADLQTLLNRYHGLI